MQSRRSRSNRRLGQDQSANRSRFDISSAWIVFVVLIVTVAIGGGSSTAVVTSLIFVRPLSIICLGLLLVLPIERDWQAVRWPLRLIGCFALWMAIQLIPLPPALWSALPGRAPFLDAAAILGKLQPWQPLTLNRDLTLGSMFALVPAVATLVAYAGFTQRERDRTVGVVLAIAFASALLALLQIVGGEGSAAYLYASTSRNLPVGLLANRNHQAALLALALPVLALWLRTHTSSRYQRSPVMLYGVGAMLAVVFILITLVTGSRAGTALCVAGVLASMPLFADRIRAMSPRSRRLLIVGVAMALLLVVLLAIAFGRALVINRLDTVDVGADQRFQAFPTLIRLIKTYFPVGSGFGTFDPVFRMLEPDTDLQRTYFNNAHDDLIELAITGGLPALLIFAGFFIWLSGLLRRALTCRANGDASITRARIGLVVIGMLLAASIVDYPLRTPLLSTILAIACCWASRFAVITPNNNVSTSPAYGD